MLFRQRGRARPARSARRADGRADRGRGSGRTGIRDTHRAARHALRYAGVGPVRGDPFGERREHLALAVDHRHRRAVRPGARGRRTAVPVHGDRRHARSGWRSPAAASSGTTCTANPRASPSAWRRASRPTTRRSRVPAAAGRAGSPASRCCCVATLALLLRWLSQPMRRLEREIKEVEAGGRERSATLGRSELAAGHQQPQCAARRRTQRIKRYRDTLGNLAHSLKTPLAVMRQSLGGAAGATRRRSMREIDRMSGIIEHQMKRAAASGGVLLGQQPVDLAPMVAELRAALMKVYGNKDLLFENSVERCRRPVHRRSRRHHRAARQPARQRLQVVPRARAHRWRRWTAQADSRDALRHRHRGRRAGHRRSGSREGAAAWRARGRSDAGPRHRSGDGARHRGAVRRHMRIDASALGGARFELKLPGRSA